MSKYNKYKNIIINNLISSCLIFYTHYSNAQIFDNSQSHFRVKWNQINTPQFRLTFPAEFKNSAPILAQNIQNYIHFSSLSLQEKPRKIDIIVQQNHVTQNGFVQLAPRKSELFSTPSGVADNQEWLPNLALHEIHHVTQFDKLTGNIKRPFGEILALGFFGINLPSWYYEGDAVLHETLFSNGGRGRLSSWNMELRANILSNKDYTFSKYIHGSFKDIVPSYYTIGYFMNSQMREKDLHISSKILEEMNGKLLRPFNFQRALKSNYGGKASKIFDETIQDLKQKWSNLPIQKTSDYPDFGDKYPTDYLLPQIENGAIYTLQRNNQRTARIVQWQVDSIQKPQEVLQLGIQIMPYFHIKNNLIVWDEFRKDARFSKQTYNVINLYNTQTRVKKTLTKNTRLYTPTLSHDLKEIACIEVNLDNESSIAILDMDSGDKTDSIPLPAGMHVQQPSYNSESTKLIAIALCDKGTTLIEIDYQTKQIHPLLEWTNLQFERPIYADNAIVFKVNQNGKDDIFRLQNGEITQLTKSNFGAFNPFVSEKKLWYNDFTTEGYKVNSLDLSNISPIPVVLKPAQTLYSSQNSFVYANIDSTTNYEDSIEPYSVLKNSVNFHSLTLSANDFESFDNYKPGIYWLSDDILNTTQLRLGYEREVELAKNTYLAEVTYQRYYPKLTIGYKNSGNFGTAKNSSGKDSLRFDFRYHQITTDIQLPFSEYRGNKVYSYGFNFGTYYIKRYDLTVSNLKNFVDQIRFPLNYQAYFNRNAMMSAMDLAPRWGQNFSFIYRHMPLQQGENSSWAFRTNFYFPGLLLNHSFQTRFSLQRTQGVFNNSYDIPLVDGFAYLPHVNLRNTLLFDYRLPLLYPDLSVSQLAYIKRIHGQVSADYLNIHHSSLAPKTISAALNFDFNLFKYNEPLFNLSLIGTYLIDPAANKKFVPRFSLSYNY